MILSLRFVISPLLMEQTLVNLVISCHYFALDFAPLGFGEHTLSVVMRGDAIWTALLSARVQERIRCMNPGLVI